MRHLIDLGHKEIRHIAGPIDYMDAQERIRGWRDCLAEHGLPAQEPLIGDWSANSGYRNGQLLAADATATAVFAGNDQMALGAIHGLADLGRRVPDDLSVIGFDDIPDAAHYAPPLTTMRQDFAQLGGDIMELVLAVLGDDQAPNPLLRVPALVRRASTALLRSS